jgi:hypothetical protein
MGPPAKSASRSCRCSNGTISSTREAGGPKAASSRQTARVDAARHGVLGARDRISLAVSPPRRRGSRNRHVKEAHLARVTPAQAGVQTIAIHHWIPAFAGMTWQRSCCAFILLAASASPTIWHIDRACDPVKDRRPLVHTTFHRVVRSAVIGESPDDPILTTTVPGRRRR